jgi:hypothetical protein
LDSVPSNTWDIYSAELSGTDAKTAYNTIVLANRKLVYPIAFVWPLAIGSFLGIGNKQEFMPETYTSMVNW